jgi:Fe-S-cluster containining protein
VYWKLKLISDTLTQHIAKEAPCKKGCSSCCHIAVPLSRTMAERISQASGRPIKKDAGTPAVEFLQRGRKDEYSLQHYGKPCPFLGHDGACTIYDDRPLTCRNHYTLHDDATPCDLDKPYGKILGYDLEWIEQLEAACDLDDLWGDIREFFG